MRQRILATSVLGLGLLSLAFLLACNGPGGGATFGSGGNNLAIAVSDPTTCGGVAGTFSHIYVTISDVQVSPDANAAPGDSSFVDLTPSLSSNPRQVDLLGTPNQCSLATLASGLTLAAGSYAQVRVFLAADGASVTGNQCGFAANCVLLNGDPLNIPHAVQMGTEVTEGIKIGPGQLAGGSFNSVADQPQTLNLSFDACASVVALGGNQYRFKPVLLAGDTGGTPSAITGQVVDSVTLAPVPNGRFIAALEQTDSNSVDRVLMETVPDDQGNFSFCPVAAATYDVVASGVRTDTGAAFAPTVTQSVPDDTDMGQIPMVAVPGSPNTAALVLGAANTANSPFAAAAADITLSALQSSTASGPINFTIPLLQAQASTVTVPTLPGSCPANTNCASFSLAPTPANPFVGIFNPAGTTYTQDAGQVFYLIEGAAFVPLSGATPDCSPSTQSKLVTVTPGTITDITAQPLSFTGCQ